MKYAHGTSSGRPWRSRRSAPYRLAAAGLFVVAAVAAVVVVGEARAHPTQARENELKAVLLERLTHFIGWPEASDTSGASGATAAADTAHPFTICICGESPLTAILHDVYADRRILEREVRVVRCEDGDVPSCCDLFFVTRSCERDLPRICAAALDCGALTVADTPGFGQRGIMINFYRDEDRVRFEINETAVHTAGFTMSYHLLKEARILQPSGDTP